MYDVFISYRRDGGYAMARLLYEHLKASGLNPFFDLEELRSGPFNTKLYESIEQSRDFVLVLPPNSLDRCAHEDDWLRLEIEHAIAKKMNIVPVFMVGFHWPEQLPESLQKLPSYNGVIMSRDYFEASIAKLLSMLISGKSGPAAQAESSRNVERLENTYFTFDDKKELRRLKIQQRLLKSFDSEVYDKLEARFDSLRVLDLGSNNGDLVMDRLGSSAKLEKLIGLEYDMGAVESGNKTYGQEGKIAFFQANVEDADLASRLEEAMAASGVESFNVIHISMLLLHLKSPFRLLRTVRSYLEKGGIIVIRDIDDGFNVAYPDEDGAFARVVDICHKNETAGYRYSGRQVYTLLKRAGYRDVTLEKLGMSTAEMDYEEREALFDTYFSFILEDLVIMCERYPNDQRIRDDYEWMRDIYEKLEERFQDNTLFFTLGFILFTATK